MRKKKIKKKSFKKIKNTKKSRKKISTKKKKIKKKSFKKIKNTKKSRKKISTKKNKFKKKSFKKKKRKKKSFKKIKTKNLLLIKKKKDSFLLKIIRLQEKLKPNIRFKINFGLDKVIKNFFQKIVDKIQEYKSLKLEEKQRVKLEEYERQEKEKIELKKQKIIQDELLIEQKEQDLKHEIKLEKERNRDLKKFLKTEQAIIRKEQAERQRKFLQELKIEQKIEKFRIREIKELEKLEKISLREQREDYAGLQERINKLKQKYQLIREQKIRERVEALGVQVQEGDVRSTLLQKEKEYTLERQKIENALESFYRSANSLVFQLNKRHITRHMSIFRCIDRRFETGEIFIKWDESSDDEWLILIYIKDNSPDKGIIIEDKSNPEKNSSNEFKPNEIFKASDMMVDSLTQLLARERSKKKLNI